MKKTMLRALWGTMLCCMAAFWLPSCSGSADAEAFTNEMLGTYASKDNAAVISIDAVHLIENSGCRLGNDKVELTQDIRDLLNKNFSDRDAQFITSVLEMPGINPARAIMIIDPEVQGEVMYIMALTSESEFCKLLTDNDFTQQDDYQGYKVMSNRSNLWLIKDGYAIINGGHTPEQSVASLDAFKAKAAASPLLPWQKSKLSDDDCLVGIINASALTANFNNEEAVRTLSEIIETLGFNAEKLLSGYMVYEIDFDDEEAKGSYAIVDSSNNPITSSLMTKTVDTSMLRYANSTHRLVVMSALDGSQDWPGITRKIVEIVNSNQPTTYAEAWDEDLDAFEFDEDSPFEAPVDDTESQLQQAEMIGEYMKYVDGTVMIAVGYKDDTNLMRLSDEEYALRQITGALAAQLAPGKASELLSLLRSQLDANNVPYEYAGAKLNVDLMGLTLEVKVDGTLLLAALNQPISSDGGCRVERSVFDGTNGGIALDIEKDNMLLSMIGVNFGIEAEMVYKNGETKCKIELEDASKPMLETIFALISRY